jgi:hypothetical protein
MAAEERRWPKGYVGKNHETIGSDVLAVLRSVQQLVSENEDDKSGQRMAQQIFGKSEVARLQKLDPNGWYPISWLLDLMELLGTKMGRFGLIKMGRTLFRMSHEERVVKTARSAFDIIHGLDAMYHHANRGEQIGGWKVLSFDNDRAELEKTTPHHCVMEEGILSQALSAVGAPAVVSQKECFRQGADSCHYVILSSSKDSRWRP